MEKVCSIMCRRHDHREKSVNPHPLVFYEVEENEKGERKFTPADPVAPSMAEDFNVINNALYGRTGSPCYRTSCDPVDFEQKMSKLL